MAKEFRELNIEAAKRGDEIALRKSLRTPVVFLGLCSTGSVAIRFNSWDVMIVSQEELVMKPVFDLYGEHIYNGDKLWTRSGEEIVVEGLTEFLCSTVVKTKDQGYVTPDQLLLAKPKKKVTAWLNLYPDKKYTRYASEEEADDAADGLRVACVQVTLEE